MGGGVGEGTRVGEGVGVGGSGVGDSITRVGITPGVCVEAASCCVGSADELQDVSATARAIASVTMTADQD